MDKAATKQFMKSFDTNDNVSSINPIALRKVKIVYNFGLSECNRINKVSNCPQEPFEKKKEKKTIKKF